MKLTNPSAKRTSSVARLVGALLENPATEIVSGSASLDAGCSILKNCLVFDAIELIFSLIGSTSLDYCCVTRIQNWLLPTIRITSLRSSPWWPRPELFSELIRSIAPITLCLSGVSKQTNSVDCKFICKLSNCYCTLVMACDPILAWPST